MQASSVADPRPFRVVLAAAVGILLLLLGVAGLRSWRDLESSRHQEAELEESIEQTLSNIQILQHRVDRLEGDSAAIESLAREELWMARPDDVVIVLPDEPSSQHYAAVELASVDRAP